MGTEERSPQTEVERKAQLAKKKREWRAAKKAALEKAKETRATAKLAKPKLKKARGYAQDSKITLLVFDNPKREGSNAHIQYSKYVDGMTVGEFYAKGGTSASLRWDEAHRFISIG